MTVTLATFMEVLDTSIANVALPHIAGSLSAGQDESTWVLTSYLVSNAIVLPISAWASDRFGRKRFYMTCVLLFTLSSLLCGLSTTLPMLIFFRVLQGAGGGGLGPSEQAILADTFLPEAARYGLCHVRHGRRPGARHRPHPRRLSSPTTIPGIGSSSSTCPSVSSRCYLTSRMVEDPPWIDDARERAKHSPVDYMGLSLIAVGLGALQVVLDKGQREDWFSSHFIQIFSVVAVAGLLGFVRLGVA